MLVGECKKNGEFMDVSELGEGAVRGEEGVQIADVSPWAGGREQGHTHTHTHTRAHTYAHARTHTQETCRKSCGKCDSISEDLPRPGPTELLAELAEVCVRVCVCVQLCSKEVTSWLPVSVCDCVWTCPAPGPQSCWQSWRRCVCGQCYVCIR